MNEERVHHPYSPSTLQNLEACPCYEQDPKSAPHPRALAGTKAHKVTETAEDDHTLSDDDAEAAAECMDFYNQRKQLLEEARQRAILNCPVSEMVMFPSLSELTETYLPVDDERIEIDTGGGYIRAFIGTTAGYFDRTIIDHTGTYAEAFDWKFGQWAIEPTKNNLQAISYVLGLFKKFPKLQSIRFFFKQPALSLVSEHLFLREQIPALLLRVKVVVARAREARRTGDFSTSNPTIPGCLFCRHVGTCPSVTRFACRVGSKFAPLKIPESVTPSMIQDPQNTGLGMQLAQVLKVWSEAFRSVTADRVLRGAPLPEGYELRSRDGSRKVVDLDAFKKHAREWLSEEEYNSALDVSIGAVEKLIGDKTPRGFKKEEIQKFKSCLETNNVVERGSPACFLQSINKKDE